MTQLVETFANIESGHAYFVHLLVPHEPYVFDENCEIRPRADWSTEWSSGTRVQRLADYGAQLSCTNRLLGKILDNVDASPAGRDAIVIIHGDHGARIAEHRPTMESSNLSPEDFAITYSTLFAVRAPGISPGTIPGRASLDELLKDFASGKFATAPSAGTRPAEVILATWDWVPKDRIPLPEYGAR